MNAACILEQRREKAEELGTLAPRVLVTGSPCSGKSTLCKILCNYSMRRGRSPLFVELDTRYSSIRQLSVFPGCLTAMPMEHTDQEEPPRRFSYFFGYLDWTDEEALYERL